MGEKHFDRPLASLALLLLLGFHLLVILRPELDPIAVGHDVVHLSAGQFRVFAAYLVLGGAAAVALALTFQRRCPAEDRLRRILAIGGSDRVFVLVLSILAFGVAALCRSRVLEATPLVDDEDVYRFAAQILAKGRLYLPGDPDPAFFEHPFVVNGDQLFSQYFLGWPALMLPFLLLGIEGYANAFYFALSMTPIFLILRQLCGPGWARLGPLLALVSPILAISAATLLSHSSCTMALAYFLWCALRCREQEASWKWHAGMALAFSVAFFIRPLSALAIGLPWLLAWLWDLKHHPRPARALLAFTLPSLFGAILFLGVNQEMNGHPLRTAYDHYLDHALSQSDAAETPHREFAFISTGKTLSIAASAIQRLNFAAFGWPLSWAFVFFAGRGHARTLLLASLGSLFVANFFTTAVGVDGYGPMHYLEAVLPILLLTVLGLKELTKLAAPNTKMLPLALAFSSTLIALVAYLPYQAQTLRAMTQLERVARTPPVDLRKPAVIFAEMPWEVESCEHEALKPWVHAPPMYDPELRGEVLWLVDVDPEKNREFARRRFPDRAAYLARWLPGCRRVFVPVEEVPAPPAGSIPQG